MATVATQPFTAEDFFEFVHQPANHDRFFELERGEIIEMPPPGILHGFVCANVARILGNFTIRRRRGYICTNDAGVIVARDPDTVRGIDVALYDGTPSLKEIERRYATQPPLLAAEVLSPHDRLNRMLVRTNELLARGVKLVWIVDPDAKDVSVYRPGQPFVVIGADEELTGYDALPDFRCRVAEFFALPGEQSDLPPAAG